MPKKKHRKKARSAKHAPHHKAAKHAAHASHSKRAKRSKSGRRHSARSEPGHRSLPLLRAIKRRRAAQNGEHLEFEGVRGSAHHHTHKKRGKNHHAGRSANHHAEPVVTEKSFENMLAYRRFQNHAR